MAVTERREVAISRGLRDRFAEMARQLRSESRHIYAAACREIVEMYDSANSETPEELRSPTEWSMLYGIQIRDPDGWRAGATLGEKSFRELIGKEEFEARMNESTVGPRV